MNTSNEESNQPDNMESLKQQTGGCGCGTGCGCHSTGAACNKARWVISAIVLLAAGVLVLRAMTKPKESSIQPPATTFTIPVTSSKTTSETPAETKAGTMIETLSELNTVAAKSGAVFVYLLGKEETSGNTEVTKALQAAVRTIEAKGTQCAIFTLKAGSPDYANLGTQVSLPGVLAFVKGKGMSPVNGEITETKLLQGYVSASNSGGCGSGGCGPKGCE